MVGVAAAIANAVYHPTGRRIRDLPIWPDRSIAAA
jgi:xanthine dehydrogenase YagR molybdenum-binding subunit